MSAERVRLATDRQSLLQEIWGEKREKVLGKAPPDTLFIALPSASVSTEEILSGTLEALSCDPLRSYEWSRHWGRTTVAVHPSKNFSFEFLDRFSPKAKAYVPVNTTRMADPRFCAGEGERERGGKYFVILNQEKCPIEGTVLQAERMVDELIWCLHLRHKALGLSGPEAYVLALSEIRSAGFDYYLLSEDAILELRAGDPRYAVRIYGNINKKGKVPSVVGAVGPLDPGVVRPQRLLFNQKASVIEIEDAGQEGSHPQKECKSLSNDCLIAMGISVAKRPHLGHLLLAGLAETTRRSLGNNTPIVIEANDTGTRVIQTVAVLSDQLGKSPDEVIAEINSGQIDECLFEDCYRQRDTASKTQLADAAEAVRAGQPKLYRQAQETARVFSVFFGKSVDLRIFMESELDRELRNVSKMGDAGWTESGFSLLREGTKLIVLEANGLPTAVAARAAFVLRACTQTGRSGAIFVDSDPSVTDALEVLQRSGTECSGVQFSGTGIGFNFKICSGTEGNSILADKFLETYSAEFTEGDLLLDILFLVNTRFQLQGPDGSLSFLDYQDYESFLEDIRKIRSERKSYQDKINRLKERLTSFPVSEKVDFGNPSSFSARRAKHLLGLASGFAGSAGKISPQKIFLKPEELEEYPDIQSKIAQTQEGVTPGSEAKKRVLCEIARGKTEQRSRLVEELMQHGYQGESLVGAIDRFVDRGFRFIRPRNILFSTIANVETILDQAMGLDVESREKMILALSICQERLFGTNV